TVPGALLVAAVQSFAAAGGTPMPGDSPPRLVTNGPYAYVANPMQLGKAGVLVAWAIFWNSPSIAFIAIAALAYSVFVASPREERRMHRRFGARWTNYRRAVGRWWPRWRPYAPANAQLFLDLSCGRCADLAAWISTRNPVGLEICPLQTDCGR